MSAFGVYLAACALLVAAGALKAADPVDTARALGELVPGVAPRTVRAGVRTVAATEALLGAAAGLFPVPALAAAVAATYAGFAVFVAVVRRRGGALASCGCFGTADTPVTALHVVVDLALAAAAATVALTTPAPTVGAVLERQPLRGVPLVAGAVLLAALVFLALAALARLQGTRRMLAARPIHDAVAPR